MAPRPQIFNSKSSTFRNTSKISSKTLNIYCQDADHNSSGKKNTHLELKGSCMSTMFSSPRFKRFMLTFALLFVLAGIAVSTFVFAQPSRTQAAAPVLSIQFTCAQAVDYRSGSVCVHTQAKAALTIKIRYCSGAYATSSSLKGTQYADTKGNHLWSWVPQTKCRGVATAYVTEILNGKSLSTSRNFSVK